MNSTTRHELMEKLYKDSAYTELKTNKLRIAYILGKMMSFDQIRESIQSNMDTARQKNSKNMSMAKNYQKEADIYFLQVSLGKVEDKKENLQNALASYNNAIVYLPSEETELLTTMYARRSTIYFELKEYRAALYSVQIAIDIRAGNYGVGQSQPKKTHPESIGTKMSHLVLKVNCLKMLHQYQEALTLIDDMLGQSEDKPDSSLTKENLLDMKQKIERLAKKETPLEASIFGTQEDEEPYHSYKLDERCKIENSPVVGRHFMATEDIVEGTVLLEEKPYSIIIESEYLQKKCSTCYKDLDYRFYPCTSCTELVFCDRKCFETTYQMFHRYECGIISLLKNITSPSFHVYRMISRIGPMEAYETERSKHNYTIDDYVAEPNQRVVPELEKSKEEKMRAYKMSSILWDHDSKHGLQANVHHVIVGIEVAVMLDITHDFRKINPDRAFLLNFIDMVVVDTRRIIFNVFGWHEYNEDWSLRGHVANCQCLVGSLINHSCVPNTNWEFSNGQIRFITNRPVAKGEEITITYGPNKDIPYPKRQERLNHYFFACRCNACVEDAKRSSALKCLDCKGPTLYNAVVNQEPTLNGQCLLCFKKYPEFETAVKDLKKSRESLKSIEKLSLLERDPILLEAAIRITKKIVDLTVSVNNNVINCIMMCSEVVEKFNKLNIEERVQCGQFIDEHLPLDIPTDLLKSRTLANMQFWHDLLTEYIPKVDKEEWTSEQCRAWNMLFRFHYRIQKILDHLGQNEHNEVVKTIMSQKAMQNTNLVEDLKVRYGSNVRFVEA